MDSATEGPNSSPGREIRRPSRLRRCLRRVDISSVTTLYTRHFHWWNWRISSRLRAGSLASVWVLIFASPLLGPLLLPIAGIRMVLGLGQLALNRELARLEPLGSRGKADWALLGVTLLASMGVAQVTESTGYTSAFLLIPVVLPFSLIQLRMIRRSLRAHEQYQGREPIQVDFSGGGRRRAA